MKLELYDVLGRTIKILVNEHKDAGIYSAQWDGTDYRGARVSSGLYVFRLAGCDIAKIEKALLLK